MAKYRFVGVPDKKCEVVDWGKNQTPKYVDPEGEAWAATIGLNLIKHGIIELDTPSSRDVAIAFMERVYGEKGPIGSRNLAALLKEPDADQLFEAMAKFLGLM